ncbi:MAG: hypothetical protein IT455_01220 [Planctomycetes bacterium]|nr:hypothetical protein [Planctomycetota bacterium]
MPKRWTQAFAVATLSAAVLAQGPASRRPTFVLVADAAGQPLAGAVVTFAGSMPSLAGAIGDLDLLQVQSDARGRARANLDARLCYVAWAEAPEEAAGIVSSSPVIGHFAAGAMLELRCTQRRLPADLGVRGADAWREVGGPLRFVQVAARPAPERELVLAAGDRLLVPAQADSKVEVRLADGAPLLVGPGEGAWLDVPPPQRVPVRVVDEAGAPLAGVSITQRVGRLLAQEPDGINSLDDDRQRLLGVTDADGRLLATVACDTDPLREPGRQDVVLIARAAGRAEVVGGVLAKVRYQNDRKVDAFAADAVQFVLPRSAPLAGRCLGVPAGSIAYLAGVCKLFRDPTNYAHDTRVWQALVDADGRFCFDSLPAELHSCRLAVVPPAASGGMPILFRAQTGLGLPDAVNAAAPVAPADLAVEAIDPLGGPARGSIGYLVPADLRGILMRDSVVRFPLDARGGAGLRVEPGAWFVVVQSERGWAAERVQVDAGAASLKLAMKPLAHMRVQLLDDQGQPIAGARLQTRSSSTRGSSDARMTVLQSLRNAARSRWQRLTTDELGRVVIAFVPLDSVTQRLGFQWQGGRSADFDLDAADDWVVVRPQ